MEVLEQKSEPLVIQAFYDKKVLTSDVEGENNLQLVLFYKTFKSFHKLKVTGMKASYFNTAVAHLVGVLFPKICIKNILMSVL